MTSVKLNSGENKCLELNTIVIEFGFPWIFVITYCRQRDLTLKVYLEIFGLQN